MLGVAASETEILFIPSNERFLEYEKVNAKELDEIRLLDLEIRATKAEHQVEVKKLRF